MKILRTSDIARAIGEVLAGRWTQDQLGEWAHQMLLDSDNGTREIELAHGVQIIKSLHWLMPLAEGTPYATFEMTPAELEEMRVELCNLGKIPDSS